MSPESARPRSRRMRRLALYGGLAGLVVFILAQPYLRQSLLGPRLRGLPFRYWQDQIRIAADPVEYGATPLSRLLEWAGLGGPPDRGSLPSGADMLPVYLSLRDEPSYQVRRVVAVALALGGPEVRPTRLRLLDDPHPEVRVAAAGGLDPRQPEDRELLARLVEDADPGCRTFAAGVLCRLGKETPPAAVEAIRAAADDADGRLRHQAFWVLALHGHDVPGGLELLAGRLRAETAPIRRAAALGLANSRYGERALPLLRGLLEDRDAVVRQHAALAAGRMGAGGRPLRPALAALEADGDPAVREAAAVALRQVAAGEPEGPPPAEAASPPH